MTFTHKRSLRLALAGAAALAFGSLPVSAGAQQAADDAEVQNAMLYLNVMMSALQSENVEQPVKGALVGCLYNNSLGKITESMNKLIAENPDRIHRDKPGEVLSAMAAVCGYRPEGAAAPAEGR